MTVYIYCIHFGKFDSHFNLYLPILYKQVPFLIPNPCILCTPHRYSLLQGPNTKQIVIAIENNSALRLMPRITYVPMAKVLLKTKTYLCTYLCNYLCTYLFICSIYRSIFILIDIYVSYFLSSLSNSRQ